MAEKNTTRDLRTVSTDREQDIAMFCHVLAERYRPVKITLFGSYAAGNARPDSDVDLLVEMEYVDSGLTAAAAILRETKPRFAVDLLIRTPQQVRERIRMGDPFMEEIVTTGKVVYESADRVNRPRVKTRVPRAFFATRSGTPCANISDAPAVSALPTEKATKKQVVFTLSPWERVGVRVAGKARISVLPEPLARYGRGACGAAHRDSVPLRPPPGAAAR